MTLFRQGKVNLVNPIATKEQWEMKNPILANGQIGFEVLYDVNNILVYTREKVGDGITQWNNLPFTKDEIVEEDFYPTSKIFGLKTTDNLKGKSALDIVKLLVNEYQELTLVTLTLKIGSGTPVANTIVALGKTITNPELYYTITNSTNLFDGNNAKIIRAGEANLLYNTTGLTTKQIIATLQYLVRTDYTILLEITGKQNEKATKSVTLSWVPEIYFGSSSSNIITTSNQVKGLGSIKLQKDRKGQYAMVGNGYSYVAIPTEFSLSNIVFKDPVTNLTYPMDYLDVLEGLPLENRTILVTNANGVEFSCNIFRSVYLLSGASTLEIL